METSRYQLVDTLYGPGTVSAWLLTLCAVLTSWTIDNHTRAKDDISIDLVAAILLPLIAIGHLVFLIARLPIPIVEVITSTDPEIQQYAAAMEAPLTVCETFAMVSLPLTMACATTWGSHANIKRYFAVFVTGFLSWIAEDVLFVMATMKGIRPEEITLNRPYLFMVTFIITSAWGFLISFIMISTAISLVFRLNQRGNHHRQDIEKPGISQYLGQQLGALRQPHQEDHVSRISDGKANKRLDLKVPRFKRAPHKRDVYSQIVESWNSVSIYGAPLAMAASTFGLGMTALQKSIPYSTAFSPIPQSNSSWRDLDQIVAFIGGVVVLVASLRSASRSRTAEQPLLVQGRRRSI